MDGRSLDAPLTVDTDLVLHAQDAAAPVKLSLIRRGDLWGVRVYDPVAAAGHDPAAEVAWFEPDDGWRLAGDLLPPEQDEVHQELASVGSDLDEVLGELRELSRGIHPAILSEGGLGPALRTLARRSSVPVELQVGTQGRLPERVEVAAYYGRRLIAPDSPPSVAAVRRGPG